MRPISKNTLEHPASVVNLRLAGIKVQFWRQSTNDLSSVANLSLEFSMNYYSEMIFQVISHIQVKSDSVIVDERN